MRKPFKWRDGWYVKAGPAGKRTNVFLAVDEGEALKKWAEMVSADKPESPTAPFAAIAEAFLAWAEKNVAAKTYKGYSDFIVSFCNLYAHHVARDLKPFHVTRWLEKNPAWAAADSQRGAISAVKRVFNWAVEQGLIDKSPLLGVRKPAGRRRENLVAVDQHAAMMQAQDGGRLAGKRLAGLGIKAKDRAGAFRPVLVALKHSGARPGMVASVRVEDVSADRTYWVMHKHKNRAKTGKPLIIFLSPCLQTMTRIAIGSRTSGPLFRNSRGSAWNANSIDLRIVKLRRKLGLPENTTPYSYRHTFITTALENGVALATAAELAGHSDLKMLSKHYAHLDKQAEHLKAAAAQAMGVRKKA
jgi:integrase